MPGFAVPTGSTFLFIGDSITDCDRTTFAAPLGAGYVRRFTELVTFHHPELDIQWINRGNGGDVIGDLRRRWDQDVVAHEPDWLAVMIGINDCHGNIEGSDEWAEEAYEGDLRFLLEQVQPFAPQLVLLDPFYVTSADGRWPLDEFQRRILARIGVYHRVVGRLAREHDAIHVRVHNMFTRQLRFRPPTFFGPEPVHPDAVGHAMIAAELYRHLSETGAPGVPDAPGVPGVPDVPPPKTRRSRFRRDRRRRRR